MLLLRLVMAVRGVGIAPAARGAGIAPAVRGADIALDPAAGTARPPDAAPEGRVAPAAIVPVPDPAETTIAGIVTVTATRWQ